ncbi:enoyl-CoA hydratase/isomerase family protein [Marinibacterium sp. SX1]|uniref:enoyl-CoA hydratase/isomerase family protein n=1 Tax=Marinibacterium sp. SX1 TaxID=3388424 RepID=UPI003D171B5D
MAAEAILQRPKARNALTTEMMTTFAQGLSAAQSDPDIVNIVVRSDVEGAFCAGGDMRRIRQHVLDRDFAAAETFFRTEYAVNLAISRSAKPVVALVDGICMGGGLGLSVHGTCLATTRAEFAMPEGLIGWFPDVGASRFLSRMPHRLGVWMGMTAGRLGAGDARAAGLVQSVLAPGDIPEMQNLLRGGASLDTLLGSCQNSAPGWSPGLEVLKIERAFSGATLTEITSALNVAGPWGAAQLAQLNCASPSSLELALDVVTGGAGQDLEFGLEREFGMACKQLRHPDFIEGVRAVLVEKDRAPRWQKNES